MEGRKQANGLKVKIRTYVHSRILQSFGGYSYSKNIRHKPIKLWFEYVCTLYILIELSTCSSKMIHNGNLVISNNFKNQMNWMGLESIFNLIIDIKNDFFKIIIKTFDFSKTWTLWRQFATFGVFRHLAVLSCYSAKTIILSFIIHVSLLFYLQFIAFICRDNIYD